MKKPGRPALDPAATESSPDVHLTLSAKTFDEADKHAKQKRETIQDTIRRALRRLLDDERG